VLIVISTFIGVDRPPFLTEFADSGLNHSCVSIVIIIYVCTASKIINFLKSKNNLINNSYLMLINVCAAVRIIFLFNFIQFK